VWGQIPGTWFGGFNFNQEIRNDGIYTKPSNDVFELSEAGDYLIIATTSDEDTSNGRYNSQIKAEQISGTWDFFTSHYTGYSRDNSENVSWTRAVSVVIWASAGSQIQIQKRRDTDAPTGWSIINASDIQIIRIDQTNYGIYWIAGTGNSYGWTIPNTVSVDSIISQSNTSAIEANLATNSITLKWDNKKYLLAWSASFNGTGGRTQRIGHLEYNGTDALSTRSYCYNRNGANQYCGLGSMDLIETATTDINVQTEVFRWDGVTANQWWADVDGTLSSDGNGQIIVIEMPDTLEAFRSQDGNGWQNISVAQTLDFARNVDFNDATSFTKISNTQISVTNNADIFSWANIWSARADIWSGRRQTSFGSIVIDWVEQTAGQHGSYSRWNQWTQDTFALWFQPAGIYTTSGPWSTIWVNTNPLAWGETWWIDTTQPWTIGFFALNLDTLTPPEPNISVTKTDNDTDNIVQTDQVVRYTITIDNTGADATGISLTDTIDTDFWAPYNFMYTSCGTPSESFTEPTLTFSSVSVNEWESCIITYDLQVDSWATGWNTITNSADASAAVEWWNNPAISSADTLTVLACGINDVDIIFETDNFWEDIYWSLTPSGNACGIGEIANWGNPNLDCTTAWTPATATAGQPYADSSIINEGPFNLAVWSQFDLHVWDDFWDGITVWAGWTDPDVRINQNGTETNNYSVTGDGWIFTFTVQEPLWCLDIVNPSVTIDQSPSQIDPTTTDSATFKVVFDEVINTGTFSSADITLAGTTGTITSGPTQVTPNNGTSFEFTVTGMTDGDTVTASIWAGVVSDIAGNTNNASTSVDNQITYTAADSTPPSIDSINFASGSLLPWGNHDVVITYSDSESWIDTWTNIMQLYKWDWVSAYGSDLFGTNMFLSSLTSTGASYSLSNLDFGKYQYRFSISDNAWNPVIQIVDFYIDEPEFIISTPEIDVGTLTAWTATFSPTVTITVRTVGAGFDVTMDRSSWFIDWAEEIPSFSWSLWYGYRPSGTSPLLNIGTPEIINSEIENININGFKNTYSYDIEIWALIDMQQAAWEYMWNLDFNISLDY